MPRPDSPENSIRTTCDSLPKVEENGRKAIFDNTQREEVKIIRVDGGLIQDNRQRADYIVSKPGLVDVIVELKGRDVNHAIEQIYATIPVWRAHPPFSPQLGALAVCSRVPATSADLQVKKAKARKAGFVLTINEHKNNRPPYDFASFCMV